MTCTYTNRDKNLEKTWPKGTAETMQVQLNILENTLYATYQILFDNGLWPGPRLESIPGKGVPHVHDIVTGMGCMPSEEQFKEIYKTHGGFGDGKQFCRHHETVGDGILNRASGKRCSRCPEVKADGKKGSESPSQAATNLTRTTEFSDAANFNGPRHTELQPLSHPMRLQSYPTPETEEQSAANSAAMSRQPSHHTPNSYGSPMDMNGRRNHNSGPADLNQATNYGSPGSPSLDEYNTMEQGSMPRSRMHHPSYGAPMGGFDSNHSFGNPGAMDGPGFGIQGTDFGVNAAGIDPNRGNPFFNPSGSLPYLGNQDDPYMGQPTTQAVTPQIRASGVQNPYMGIMGLARSSSNGPTGAISSAMSTYNDLMGASGNHDQMPADPPSAGNCTGRSQGNLADTFDFDHFYQAVWDGFENMGASQVDATTIDPGMIQP